MWKGPEKSEKLFSYVHIKNLQFGNITLDIYTANVYSHFTVTLGLKALEITLK